MRRQFSDIPNAILLCHKVGEKSAILLLTFTCKISLNKRLIDTSRDDFLLLTYIVLFTSLATRVFCQKRFNESPMT